MSLQIPDQVPEPGFYYHYKHRPENGLQDYAYEFLGITFHTEPDCRPEDRHLAKYRPLYESAAVYQASKKLGMVCEDGRPLAMWMGNVTKGDKTFPRFKKITDPVTIEKLEEIRDQMYPPKAD